ncbi:MAG TPA: exodeoxyribonuclease VII small subunit [Phycisphaerales bacterium]|jgi:exodeoxyribonuclease VII small subunit|nr:exodeoxyribonuclease VII small subunit [Phycisphaerales bacterium]
MTESLPESGSMGFDAAVVELEAIIQRIDAGEIELEEAMAAHRRGRALVLRCRQVLDAAEKELETSWQDDAPTQDGQADT